jgi:hypothetical protein
VLSNLSPRTSFSSILRFSLSRMSWSSNLTMVALSLYVEDRSLK